MAQGLPELGPGELLLPSSGGRITPSNINVWRAVRRADERYSTSQLVRMKEWGLDQDCEDVIVRSPASQSELWWGSEAPTPIYLLPCPILERGGDGSKCLVISPYGTKEWVYSNGMIRKKPQMGFDKGRVGRRSACAGPRQ